jgi:8-hydroxy-5-deazaflavin:NADPH oxidoreductase
MIPVLATSSVATLGNPAQKPAIHSRGLRHCGPSIDHYVLNVNYDISYKLGDENEHRYYRSGCTGLHRGRLLARSGISATIANSRGPASLAGLVGELGPSIKAGTVGEAASADIVLVAVRWVDLGKALGRLPAWNGRIVIDSTNPVAFLDPDSPDAKDPSNPLAAYGIKAIDLGGKHSSEVFREFVPGARVVKAFNHLDVNVLSEPAVSGGQRPCSIRATMPTRRPRLARSSNRPAIFRSTSACSMWVDLWPRYRSVRLRPSILSRSDRQKFRAKPGTRSCR